MLSLRGGKFTTLFAYRIDPAIDWIALVGPDRLRDAMARDTAVTAAIAAGKWGQQAAFAVLSAIERNASGASCLCALRRGVPFDAVEAAGAYAASLHAASYWLKNYLLRGGFLDGAMARVYHACHARYVFEKYEALRALDRR